MKRAKSEKDGDEKLRQPYLSGAYIRSFVKQLATSRSMREKTSIVERESADPAAKPQQQQHKKQVRRRLQTRKPYQEKMLNMAEARREIVTALKLHRAAMKEQQQLQQQEIKSTPDFQIEQKSRRNPRIYASNTDDNFAGNNVVAHSPYFCSWPAPAAPPPPVFLENLDFALPSQALGLNLNLHDFIIAPLSIYSSTSSSPPPPLPPPPPPHALAGGERFEFLNYGEITGGEEEREEEVVNSPFDEVMEFPPWLNANESCLQLHVDDFGAQDFFQGSVLPCMDIEEIEGMDGDWLA